jgi:ankyrin repeat protein
MTEGKSLYSHLQGAIEDRNFLKLQEIIEKGIDLDGPYLGDDQTALALACELGHIDIAKVLVSAGATLDARMGKDGETALFTAIFYNQFESVKFLIESGASPNIECYQGTVPINIAYDDDGNELTEIYTYLTQKIEASNQQANE